MTATQITPIDVEVQTKMCTKCGGEKSLDDFYRRSDYPSSYTSHCKECILSRQRSHYNKNKEHKLKSNRAWHHANKEKISARKRTYRQNNKARISQKGKEWYRNNKERVYIRTRKRNALVRNVKVGNVPHRNEILKKQGDMCANCKTKKGLFEMDHIVPIKLGGEHSKHNVQVLCKACNRSKGAKHPSEWAKENGKLL